MADPTTPGPGPVGADPAGPRRTDEAIEALTAEIDRLKAENARLRDELRRARRDHHETPPHYL